MFSTIYAVVANALFTLALIADPFFGFPPAPPTPAPAPTAVATATPTPALSPIAVAMTAYTCAPGTPMYPCGLTANGSDPAQPGMACPRAWLNRWFYVPNFGWLQCDDTPRHDYLFINGRDLPHVDVRVPDKQTALNLGFTEGTIYED